MVAKKIMSSLQKWICLAWLMAAFVAPTTRQQRPAPETSEPAADRNSASRFPSSHRRTGSWAPFHGSCSRDAGGRRVGRPRHKNSHLPRRVPQFPTKQRHPEPTPRLAKYHGEASIQRWTTTSYLRHPELGHLLRLTKWRFVNGITAHFSSFLCSSSGFWQRWTLVVDGSAVDDQRSTINVVRAARYVKHPQRHRVHGDRLLGTGPVCVSDPK